eukprot:357924-Chlamydomonas_euryale.AAC.6
MHCNLHKILPLVCQPELVCLAVQRGAYCAHASHVTCAVRWVPTPHRVHSDMSPAYLRSHLGISQAKVAPCRTRAWLAQEGLGGCGPGWHSALPMLPAAMYRLCCSNLHPITSRAPLARLSTLALQRPIGRHWCWTLLATTQQWHRWGVGRRHQKNVARDRKYGPAPRLHFVRPLTWSDTHYADFQKLKSGYGQHNMHNCHMHMAEGDMSLSSSKNCTSFPTPCSPRFPYLDIKCKSTLVALILGPGNCIYWSPQAAHTLAWLLHRQAFHGQVAVGMTVGGAREGAPGALGHGVCTHDGHNLESCSVPIAWRLHNKQEMSMNLDQNPGMDRGSILAAKFRAAPAAPGASGKVSNFVWGLGLLQLLAAMAVSVRAQHMAVSTARPRHHWAAWIGRKRASSVTYGKLRTSGGDFKGRALLTSTEARHPASNICRDVTDGTAPERTKNARTLNASTLNASTPNKRGAGAGKRRQPRSNPLGAATHSTRACQTLAAELAFGPPASAASGRSQRIWT